MKASHIYFVIFCAVLTIASCTPTKANRPIQPAATEQLEPTGSPLQPTKPDFRIIAYTTSAIVAEAIPYDKLTHINYSFLIPQADGSLQSFPNGWKLKKIVEMAHKKNVKVIISVGGWGWDKEFEELAAEPSKRALFVQNLVAFVEEYNLDGVDMDWEYPDAGESGKNFLALMRELRVALPQDKLLTAAVVAYGQNGEGILSEVFNLVDFLNLMTYDGEDHGTMEQARSALAYWKGRGLSAEKTVLGAPFYTEPGGVPYKKVVSDFPEAAQVDKYLYNGAEQTYNGLPTIREKTLLALQEANGMMFWTLEQDSSNSELSLLNAIFDTVVQESR